VHAKMSETWMTHITNIKE